MKRVILLATMVALVAMLALAPVALAQGTMATPTPTSSPSAKVPPSGGPAILLPAAALLLGSGVLTYAILRRR